MIHDMKQISNNPKPDTIARIESDSHADTNCNGKNMTLLSYTGYECNVNGFHSALKFMNKIPVMTVVTAYDDPLSAATVMLVFNPALWFVIAWNNHLSQQIKFVHMVYSCQMTLMNAIDHLV